MYFNQKILVVFRILAAFNQYSSATSTTYIPNGKPFSITYANDYSVQGFLSIDTVTISGIIVKNQTIAQCAFLNGMTGNVNDGIFGLAYSSLTKDGEKPVFYNMWSQGLISEAIFSSYFNPDPKAISGGVDSSKYTVSVTYAPVVLAGYLEFQMTSVTVGSTIVSRSANAIIDTGTSLTIGPVTEVRALNHALGGTLDSSSGLV
ncbi:unnamed protein product [Rotaria sp. Silwood2]|nr:unnamed protein product [Rotaria sp. Silwood2]CAF4103659.1 unnamed protein product [Rotaria sp. Silwood2]